MLKVGGAVLSGNFRGNMILKTGVSHRGTETTEAADKELYLRKALRNCYPLGEDKAPENRSPVNLLCALCDSVATSPIGWPETKFPFPPTDCLTAETPRRKENLGVRAALHGRNGFSIKSKG